MNNHLDDKIRFLTEKYPEYAPEAYELLRNGLEYTVENYSKGNKGAHLTAEQLYTGTCAYALMEYGPMARMVLEVWGIETSRDFGSVVYNLIEVGIFGKQKGDSREEFDNMPPLDFILDAPYVGDFSEEEDDEPTVNNNHE